MTTVRVSVDHDLISKHDRHAVFEKLTPALAHVNAMAASDYATDYASLELPLDETNRTKAAALAKSLGTIDCLVVIGIGGSNLGTLAIHQALHGSLHNGIRTPRIFFADTVDAVSMRDIHDMVQAHASAHKRVVLNLVSKSGTTTESIANFAVLYETLKKHDTNANQHVVITTDEGSALAAYAKQHDFHVLTIPKHVGGRYSVLSAVGLFPLAVLGVDLHALLAGAKEMRDDCLTKPLEHNPAALLASSRFASHKPIHDLFVFATDLEPTGKWWRQLVGESLGKEWNKAHTKQVHTGYTPTVSVGSTDLHSVGQLYLGGPQNKHTTFLTIEKRPRVAIPTIDGLSKLVPHLDHKDLHTVMHAIEHGVTTAYREHQLPFAHITLSELTPHALGAYLQLEMITTILLAELLDVNAFDQPNVESYKIETKKRLADNHNH